MQQFDLFRPATADDAPAIAALVNSGYRGESSRQGWTTEAHLLDGQRIDADKVRELIAAPAQVVLVWPDDTTSQIHCCVLLERRGDLAYLGMLTVNPGLQNSGLGRKILQTSEEWVKREWNSKVVEMTVISVREELVAWYQRRGYRLTEERREFPMKDERFGLPKVDHLEFVVLVKSI